MAEGARVNKLKQKFGLSSDKAGDAKAAVYGSALILVILEKVSDAVTGMDAGWDKTLLLALVLGALGLISWLQVGSGKSSPDTADTAAREVEALENPEDIVRRGRS